MGAGVGAKLLPIGLRAARDLRRLKQGAGSPAPGEILAELTKKMELFHSPEGDAYAKIAVDDHHEICAIKSRDFERRLARYYYRRSGKALSAQTLTDALRLLEAQAQIDGPEHPVFLRVAEHDGAIYLDLANAAWEVVEIMPAGWAVIGEVIRRQRLLALRG